MKSFCFNNFIVLPQEDCSAPGRSFPGTCTRILNEIILFQFQELQLDAKARNLGYNDTRVLAHFFLSFPTSPHCSQNIKTELMAAKI
jgi:hypothetical protein